MGKGAKRASVRKGHNVCGGPNPIPLPQGKMLSSPAAPLVTAESSLTKPTSLVGTAKSNDPDSTSLFCLSLKVILTHHPFPGPMSLASGVLPFLILGIHCLLHHALTWSH